MEPIGIRIKWGPLKKSGAQKGFPDTHLYGGGLFWPEEGTPTYFWGERGGLPPEKSVQTKHWLPKKVKRNL